MRTSAPLTHLQMVGVCGLVCGFILLTLLLVDEDAPDRPQQDRILFTATRDWQEVHSYHICPAGLEFRMDLDTGRSFARLCSI